MTTDVRSPGGWLQLYGVRIAKDLVIGALGLAAILNIYGPVNFKQGTGTSTGAVLQVDGTNRFQTFSATCTATGGLTNYSTCYLSSPLSTTGSLLEVGLECGNVPKQLTGDVSFKKTRLAASGAVLTNLDNIVAGTGSLERSAFATEVKWNPADKLTFSTLITPGSGVDCQLWATIADKYGS